MSDTGGFAGMGRNVRNFAVEASEGQPETVAAGDVTPIETNEPEAAPVSQRQVQTVSTPERLSQSAEQSFEGDTDEDEAEHQADRIDAGVPSTEELEMRQLENASTRPHCSPVPLGGEDLSVFLKEYQQDMPVTRCVADRNMLLQYMAATEHRYNLTLSFPAYGVAPIVFDEEAAARVKRYHDEETTPPLGDDIIEIEFEKNGEKTVCFYEKIEVDGVLYLSSMSECLDSSYLYSIIREATEEIYCHGQYMYTLVGPRPLPVKVDGDNESYAMIETLKLNSYELSVLTQYLENLNGVSAIYGTFEGQQVILFKKDKSV